MAAVQVKFSVTLDHEKISGQCVVYDDEPMFYVCANGLEISGDVLVDGPHVSFDLELQKDNEIICAPWFDGFLGTKAKVKIEDHDKNTLFKFSIVATEIEEDIQEGAEEGAGQDDQEYEEAQEA